MNTAKLYAALRDRARSVLGDDIQLVPVGVFEKRFGLKADRRGYVLYTTDTAQDCDAEPNADGEFPVSGAYVSTCFNDVLSDLDGWLDIWASPLGGCGARWMHYDVPNSCF